MRVGSVRTKLSQSLAASCTTSDSATTRRPPVISGSSISRTEISNDIDETASIVSPTPALTARPMAVSTLITARWVTRTPLGLPVDPDV